MDSYENNEDEIMQDDFTPEKTIDKNAMESLIDTQHYLKSLEKQFKGQVQKDSRWEKVSDEIATNKFIDKMIGGLRSIINQFTIYTYLDESEVENILKEKNIEFIKACIDEPSIEDPNDLALMVNIFDHALQTFMGLPSKGHGSIFLRDLGGGLSQGLEHIKDKNKNGIINDLSSIFSIRGKR
jgi:hypothetical protein